ncbi:MAG: hypothetical protein HYR84_09790, partial [Planctomycetes bacterium]|nr:hypothetical protein [Planctomycetota bacterium]
VFNTSLELGNIMQWYAPDVRYCLDTRRGLFPGLAAQLDRVRVALSDPDHPQKDWQDLFRERAVDQAAISLFRNSENHRKQAQLWWSGAEHWRQRFADHRVLVFSWSGPGKTWPADEWIKDLNRQAFGEAPEAERPPLRGTPAPESPSTWMLYLQGVDPTPQLVGDAAMQQFRYRQHNFWTVQGLEVGSMVFVGTSTTLSGSSGALGPVFSFSLQKLTRTPLTDFGPPAIPILALRAARRAVAENPLDADTHKLLLTATETLRTYQEDFWAGIIRSPRSQHPSVLRDRIRQTQMLASAYHAVQLQSDNPELHEELAKVYLQQNLRDLALEHIQLAFKGHESRIMAGKYGPKNPKEREMVLKEYYNKMVDPIDKSVRRRLAKFRDNTAMLTPPQKVQFALIEPFDEFVEGGGVDRTALGLGKKAFDLLTAIDEKSLTKDEQPLYLRLRFDLLLAIGNVDVAKANIEQPEVRKAIPPLDLAQIQLFVGGALGEYANMDEALLSIEKELQERVRQTGENLSASRAGCVASAFFGPTMQSGNAMALALTLQTLPVGLTDDGKEVVMPFGRYFLASKIDAEVNNDYFNAKALRGMLALEAGDTKRARAILEDTLKEAGADRFFSDRRIAQRYLDLLKEQAR